ncbi:MULTISPECIES: methylglyoxal synthase [unclassified Oleiphilus]|jgi:methylglyoxal synthase|uniref:methylglyoxal synthase n=5 Tax=Oleiphilus TaxID=141450 RepID=UPI0007C29E4A|nr:MULTISPECIES: methylglyoxal synthase [unclassified Oleiphilus]KZY44322.1 methylglyoxal synthase [Oleiphilus sp. HI0050]KZY72832.1 methylglyoxal synthase [Oleiphilus sp. HI0068]KZY75997.1 methylglyoxal synthase [Oleiphilus sp. HI0069]KZY87951.1 methylglyoxal synthase [Oleiphilus sp. HI0072]KZZ09467.1 methylglyoxal synthase [Oleiphilus sp. HI0078]KZZ20196.1 methylglyoxal synthase [Oleiphilus sp. HI0081]KZZ33962.1 methylglyoxal synthase [Oleiphilus sp. HI0085]
MNPIENIALIAHDNRKSDLVAWLNQHIEALSSCQFTTTGTSGKLIEEKTGLSVNRVQSGPLGGDQQIGALIADGKIDLLIFFWDPLEPMSHDPDIKALLRLATLWNIPVACNKSTADFIVHSPLMNNYQRETPDFSDYQNRPIVTK